jgi:hypothetical protein
MPTYDYLEVAPTDASTGLAWATTTEKCGSAVASSCRTSFLSDAGTPLNYFGLGTGRAATALIVARHNAGSVAKTAYPAGIADTYTTATASDWFLPSKDELNAVCKYARDTGQEAGASDVCTGGTLRTGVGGFAAEGYWSSTEDAAANAWFHNFDTGFQYGYPKASNFYVRPVRAF